MTRDAIDADLGYDHVLLIYIQVCMMGLEGQRSMGE